MKEYEFRKILVGIKGTTYAARDLVKIYFLIFYIRILASITMGARHFMDERIWFTINNFYGHKKNQIEKLCSIRS